MVIGGGFSVALVTAFAEHGCSVQLISDWIAKGALQNRVANLVIFATVKDTGFLRSVGCYKWSWSMVKYASRLED